MNQEKRSKIKKYIINDLLLFGGLFVVFGIAYILWGINCPLRLLFKVHCPFCGMTRAHLAALRFDFQAAFQYHPLFFLGIPYILLLTHEEHFPQKAKKAYRYCVYFLTALFIACYVIRYIMPLF